MEEEGTAGGRFSKRNGNRKTKSSDVHTVIARILHFFFNCQKRFSTEFIVALYTMSEILVVWPSPLHA